MPDEDDKSERTVVLTFYHPKSCKIFREQQACLQIRQTLFSHEIAARIRTALECGQQVLITPEL